MFSRPRFGVARRCAAGLLALVVAAGLLSTRVLFADVPYQRADSETMQRKIDQIVAASASTAGPEKTRVTPLSEREVNAYLRFHLRDEVPAGITEPVIRIHGNGRVSGEAIVDLDAVSRARKSPSLLDPMRYLTGRLPVTAEGRLETANGIGRFIFHSATVSGVPVPRTVLQHVLSHYSRTPQNPDGLGLEDTFSLPAEIREIRVEPGQALVVQ